MAKNYTRRAFLAGRPIRDAVENGSESDESSDNQSEQPRSIHAESESDAAASGQSRPWLTPMLFRIAAITILLIAVGLPAVVGVAESASVSPPSAVAQPDDGSAEQCDPPNANRRTAHDRLDALQWLDAEESVDVPDESLQAVERQVADGDSSYSLQEYCDAAEAYRGAIEQGTPTLRVTYRDGTIHLLDATSAMVAAERTDSNPDPDAGALTVEIERERAALANASSVVELADRYERAAALREDATARLPTKPHEQLIEVFLERRVLTGYATVMTLLAGGLIARQWWHDDENRTTIPDTPR
jgi:hypothetical protein